MPLAKPASKTDWSVGNPDFANVTQEPTAQFKEDAWGIDQKPPREFMNWLFFNNDQWIKYLESITDELIAGAPDFDATVGVNGTHATITAAIAAVGVDKRIFVLDPQSLTATTIINVEGIELTFHPSAAISKGATTTIGLQVDAKRVKILGGRFLNFDEAGGKAIELTANAKNCFIKNNTFSNNTDEIDDLGANNIKTDNMVEVV